MSCFNLNANMLLKADNKGRFCSNSDIDTLISKRLFMENKVKLSLRVNCATLLVEIGSLLYIESAQISRFQVLIFFINF